MKYILAFFLFTFLADERLVTWKSNLTQDNQTATLTFEGNIKPNWYVYSSKLEVDGPLPTEIRWDKSDSFQPVESLIPVDVKKKHDQVWEGTIHYFDKKAVFTQKIKLLKPNAVISGTLKYQVCINDPEDGMCVNEEQKFSFKTN